MEILFCGMLCCFGGMAYEVICLLCTVEVSIWSGGFGYSIVFDFPMKNKNGCNRVIDISRNKVDGHI